MNKCSVPSEGQSNSYLDTYLAESQAKRFKKRGHRKLINVPKPETSTYLTGNFLRSFGKGDAKAHYSSSEEPRLRRGGL